MAYQDNPVVEGNPDFVDFGEVQLGSTRLFVGDLTEEEVVANGLPVESHRDLHWYHHGDATAERPYATIVATFRSADAAHWLLNRAANRSLMERDRGKLRYAHDAHCQ